MRSWKKMWKDELDALPPVGRQVLDAPSPAVCDEVTVNADGSLTRKKKILAFTLPPALVAVVLAVVLVCVFLLPVRDAVQRYAFMLEINPSVTVVTDADGTVTSVAATNADADIVLADGVAESMLGKPVGDALVIFADRAAMLGFIDTEGESAVRLTSCGDGGELLSDARETLETHFMEDGIYALVLSAERTVSDFAALCGAAASDTVSAVADFVENVSVFFRNRGALFVRIILSAKSAAPIFDIAFFRAGRRLVGVVRHVVVEFCNRYVFNRRFARLVLEIKTAPAAMVVGDIARRLAGGFFRRNKFHCVPGLVQSFRLHVSARSAFAPPASVLRTGGFFNGGPLSVDVIARRGNYQPALRNLRVAQRVGKQQSAFAALPIFRRSARAAGRVHTGVVRHRVPFRGNAFALLPAAHRARTRSRAARAVRHRFRPLRPDVLGRARNKYILVI